RHALRVHSLPIDPVYVSSGGTSTSRAAGTVITEKGDGHAPCTITPAPGLPLRAATTQPADRCGKSIEHRRYQRIMPDISGLRPLKARVQADPGHLHLLTFHSKMSCQGLEHVLPELLLRAGPSEETESK